MGQHKDKKQRITDALNDLRLVLAGLANGGEGRRKESEIIQATGSLARACSGVLEKGRSGRRAQQWISSPR